MKKVPSLVVTVLALVATVWWFSPYWALHQLDKAVKAKDATAINERVDYPKLRESIRTQLKISMMKDMPTEGGAFAAMGAMFAVTMVDKMVDTFISPEALIAMLNGAGKDQQKATAGSAARQEEEPAPEWNLERNTADVATLRVSNKGQSKTLNMTLQRQGFVDWKITSIQMPSI